MLSASSTDCCRKNDTTPSFGQTLQTITNFPVAPPLIQLAGEGCQFFHGDRLFLCAISHDQTSPAGSLFTFLAGSLSPDIEREPVQILLLSTSQGLGTKLSYAWLGAKMNSPSRHWPAKILHLQLNDTMKTKPA